jgi:hypothetical protein
LLLVTVVSVGRLVAHGRGAIVLQGVKDGRNPSADERSLDATFRAHILDLPPSELAETADEFWMQNFKPILHWTLRAVKAVLAPFRMLACRAGNNAAAG